MTEPEVGFAGQWWAQSDCGQGVTLIQEPWIKPYYRCNIWHVRGRDRSMLVDSGLGSVSLVNHFRWLLDEPLIAVASHTHFDHIGNHHEFSDRLCHSAEASVMANPDRHSTLAEQYASLEMFERLPPGGFDPSTYRLHPAPATRVVEAGDVVDLGDRHFEIKHVPGHSPGSIALWEKATGILIAGDTIYDGPLIDDLFHSNGEQYIESMRLLRELPVSVVHAGHYPSFGRNRFVHLVDEYLAGRRAPGCPANAATPAGVR